MKKQPDINKIINRAANIDNETKELALEVLELIVPKAKEIKEKMHELKDTIDKISEVSQLSNLMYDFYKELSKISKSFDASMSNLNVGYTLLDADLNKSKVTTDNKRETIDV